MGSGGYVTPMGKAQAHTGWEATHGLETSTWLHQIRPLSIVGLRTMQFQGHLVGVLLVWLPTHSPKPM